MIPTVIYWLSDMQNRLIILWHPRNVVHMGSLCNDGGKSKKNYYLQFFRPKQAHYKEKDSVNRSR
jgi:hypothetical protein